MKSKKTIIIICLVIILIIGTWICIYLMQSKKHTVSDFAIYPCPFQKADKIKMFSEHQQVTLQKQQQKWKMIAPYQEGINSGAEMALNQFLASKMLIDEKREITSEEKVKLESDHPTHVAFYQNDKELCAFELGRGYKLPTVDSERRWMFPKDTSLAYRTFVPLQDFGTLFEQPVSGWRILQMLEFSLSSIETIEVWTQGESWKIDKNGSKSTTNPMGWRLADAKSTLDTVDVEHFDIDIVRVSTILELMTPFYVDDWADRLPDDEKRLIQFGGKLTVQSHGKMYELSIGSEVDLSKHPEYRYLGEGARYIQLKGSPRVGVVSAQRLMGIFPSLDDMRTKDVWHVDTSHLSKIEIHSGDACLNYMPGTAQQWEAVACVISPESDEKPVLIHPEALGNYAKTVTSLQAVRYVSAEEKPLAVTLLSQPAAEVQLYFDHEALPQKTLVLSEPQNALYRYATVRHADNTSGPVFVITDGIARLLLTDLRYEMK